MSRSLRVHQSINIDNYDYAISLRSYHILFARSHPHVTHLAVS